MEQQKNKRRGFLGKLSLGLSGLMVAPLLGEGKTASAEESVFRIKELGFQWDTQDPFLFCVHHEDKFPNGNARMAPEPGLLQGRQIGMDFLLKDGWRMYHGHEVPGFPGHPHRGFETITVVREGVVDHADSMGAAGRYGNGDVQWMTAGGGIQHSEMFPLINKDKPNPMELFQIWLNLPRKDKMVAPHFKMLWSGSIPKYPHKDQYGNKTIVEVIAGTIDSCISPTAPPNSWAHNPANEVAVWNIKMEAGASWMLPKASVGINRTLYFYKGNSLTIDGTSIPPYHKAEVLAHHNILLKSGNSGSGILLLQGKPIGEPVVQHGPFVMNTQQEIKQAFDDYQRTQFGGWPWPKNDVVHPREKGRFARHADGRVEEQG